MEGRRDRGTPTLLGVVVALGLAACASASWAQDRGACVTSDVPESFTIPDGSLHAAGRLTLCTVLALNPVVGLHRLWPDGDGARFVMSRRARAEATAENRPFLLFQCAPGEPLDLVGYVLPDGRRSWSYRLRRTDLNGFVDPAMSRAVRNPQRLGNPNMRVGVPVRGAVAEFHDSGVEELQATDVEAATPTFKGRPVVCDLANRCVEFASNW